MNNIDIIPGEVYFIPLFLGTDYSTKSYSRFKFGEGDQVFYFCRIIKDQAGAGILVEVFDYVGKIDSSVETITKHSRLIDPVHIVGDGIKKKRWRKVGKTFDYDAEKNSHYSSIKFTMGRGDDRRVWCNGNEFSASEFDNTGAIEHHILWSAAQLENRLITINNG
jgi:hypothetical protein